MAVAVDGARPGDGKPVAAIGIDQRGKVVKGLPLHAGTYHGEVTNAIAALQTAALLNEQVRAGLEEQRAADERATGNDHHAAAILRAAVDDGLQRLGLHLG